MILADTSIWIEHFHGRERRLAEMLAAERVVMHPFVLGELACGTLPRRQTTIEDLTNLPCIATASDDDVLHAIELHDWWGKDIGWIDAHQLAAALISKTSLWTRDQRVHNLAKAAGVAH